MAFFDDEDDEGNPIHDESDLGINIDPDDLDDLHNVHRHFEDERQNLERERAQNLFDYYGDDYEEMNRQRDAEARREFDKPEFPGAPWRKPYPNTAVDIPGFGMGRGEGHSLEPWQGSKSHWLKAKPLIGEDQETINHELGVPKRSLSSNEPGLEVREYEGEPGNPDHITRSERGMIPIDWVRNMMGARGERPGEHRNRQGQDWEDFKQALTTAGDSGIHAPIFITVDYGKQPVLAEGNHRRDAYADLGATHVPAEIRYFGHSERQGTVGERAEDRMRHMGGVWAEDPEPTGPGQELEMPESHKAWFASKGWTPRQEPLTGETFAPHFTKMMPSGVRHSLFWDGARAFQRGEPVYQLESTVADRAKSWRNVHADKDPIFETSDPAAILRKAKDNEKEWLTGQRSGPGVLDFMKPDNQEYDNRFLVQPFNDSPANTIGQGEFVEPKEKLHPDWRGGPGGRSGLQRLNAVDDSGLKAAGIAVIALDTGRVLMQQRALNPLHCPCGLGVTWDPMNGYQHDDGSVSHDGEFYGQSVSDLLDQGHPDPVPCPCCNGTGDDLEGSECAACDGSGSDPHGSLCDPPCRDPESMDSESDTGADQDFSRYNDLEGSDTSGFDKTAALEFDPNEGTWEFPGGKIDPGESPRDAAIREFKEEVGQSLPPGVFVGAWVSPGGISVTAAPGKVDPQYLREFHNYLDREVSYSPEEFAGLSPQDQQDLVDSFGDYIGEDHPRDARYHLDIGDAGHQKVRTATPGRMVRVLRIEKPNGKGPFGYDADDNLMPHPYGDDSHDVPYTLMNPLRFEPEDGPPEPDDWEVRQRQPYADKIPARYVRGRVFGFLPQHNVGDYFNPKTLRGLHDLGYGVSQYDVPGEHVLLGRTQVAWEPEHATQVSHTAIPEHFDLANMRRSAAWFVYEGNAADPIVDGADPRATDPNDMQYGIDGVCPVPGRGGDQTYANGQPPVPGQQMPRVAMPLPGDDEFADSIPHGQNNSSRNTKIQDEMGYPVLRKNMYSIKGADNEVFGSLVHRAIGSNAARVVHDVEGDPNVVMVQMADNLSPAGGYVEHSLPWGTGLRKPKSAATPSGIMTGLGDLLTRERDSNFNNWGILPDGTPYRYDFEQTQHSPDRSGEITENALGEPIHWSDNVHSDFAHHFTDGPKEDKFQPLSDNPLHPEHDVPRITAALQALRPDYLAHDRKDWHNELMRRWGEVAPYAKGTTSVLKNIVLPHERVLDPRYAATPTWEDWPTWENHDQEWPEESARVPSEMDIKTNVTQPMFKLKNDVVEYPWESADAMEKEWKPEDALHPLHHLAKKGPVYKGFIYLIQRERDIDLGNREIANPDDPDGDMTEQSAWWEIDHAKKNPALRQECKKGTPWDELELWADKSVRENKQVKEALAKLAALPSDSQGWRDQFEALTDPLAEEGAGKDNSMWQHVQETLNDPEATEEQRDTARKLNDAFGEVDRRAQESAQWGRDNPGRVALFESNGFKFNPDSGRVRFEKTDENGWAHAIEPNDRDGHYGTAEDSGVGWRVTANHPESFYGLGPDLRPIGGGKSRVLTAVTGSGADDDSLALQLHGHNLEHSDFITHGWEPTRSAGEYLKKEDGAQHVAFPNRRTEAVPGYSPIIHERPGWNVNTTTFANPGDRVGKTTQAQHPTHLDAIIAHHGEGMPKISVRVDDLEADRRRVRTNPKEDPEKKSSRNSPTIWSIGGEPYLEKSVHKDDANNEFLASLVGRSLGADVSKVMLNPRGDTPAKGYTRSILTRVVPKYQDFINMDHYQRQRVRENEMQSVRGKRLGLLDTLVNVGDHNTINHGTKPAPSEPTGSAPHGIDYEQSFEGLHDFNPWKRNSPYTQHFLDQDGYPQPIDNPLTQRDVERGRASLARLKPMFDAVDRGNDHDALMDRWEKLGAHATGAEGEDILPENLPEPSVLARESHPTSLFKHIPETGQVMHAYDTGRGRWVHRTFQGSDDQYPMAIARAHENALANGGDFRDLGYQPGYPRYMMGSPPNLQPRVSSGLNYPTGFPEDYVDPRPKLPEGLRYHDAPDQPYQSVGNEDFWRFQDPTLIPPLNKAMTQGYQIGQNISHPRAVDVQPLMITKPDSEYQDEEAFDAANALSSPRGSKTEVKWNDPICENCYLRHGDIIPEWRHSTAMRKYYDDLGEEKHEFNPINPEFVHGKLKEARVAMPLTQDEPVLMRKMPSGEGANTRHVRLPSGDWLAKNPEDRALMYETDPAKRAKLLTSADKMANMEEFASRLGRALSDREDEPLTPEVIRSAKKSDVTPTVYVKRYDNFRDLLPPEGEGHVDTPRGQQLGYLHAVLGDSDKENFANTGIIGDKIISHDHTLGTLPEYADALASGDSHRENFMRWNHDFVPPSPFEKHFLATPNEDTIVPVANPLGVGDTERAISAAETMRPWAQDRGIEHWVDAAQQRMNWLGEHATGTKSMFPYQMPHEAPQARVAAVQKEAWVTWEDQKPSNCGYECMVKKMKTMDQDHPLQAFMVDHRPHGGRVRWRITNSNGVHQKSGSARNATLAENDMMDSYTNLINGMPPKFAAEDKGEPWWKTKEPEPEPDWVKEHNPESAIPEHANPERQLPWWATA